MPDTVCEWCGQVLTAEAERNKWKAKAGRERKARKAAEALNADEVLKARTNLEAQIAYQKVEADEWKATAERLVAAVMEVHWHSLVDDPAPCPLCKAVDEYRKQTACG